MNIHARSRRPLQLLPTAVLAGLFSMPLFGASPATTDAWLSAPYAISFSVKSDTDINEKQLVSQLLRGLGPACVLSDDANAQLDKRFEVTIVRDVLGYRVSVREYDAWIRDLGETTSAVAPDLTMARATAVRLVANAFRPVCAIQRKEEIYLAYLKGAALDRRLRSDFASNAVWFRPFLLFEERDGQWRSTQPIPWTYLRLNSSPNALDATIEVESAFPAPLPGRLRRGTIVALSVPVSARSTELTFVDAETGGPRMGLRVNLRGVRSSESESAATEEERERNEPSSNLETLRIDRRGKLTIPHDVFDAPGKLVRMQVLSTEPLVDVPLLLGGHREIEVAVPRDFERVELAERLQQIETALTDVVARRAVVIAEVKAATAKRSWVRVDDLLSELDDLPDGSKLRVALRAARVGAIAKARERGDLRSVSRIERQCARLDRTLEEFISPTVDNALRDEIEAQKAISKEAAKLPQGDGGTE